MQVVTGAVYVHMQSDAQILQAAFKGVKIEEGEFVIISY